MSPNLRALCLLPALLSLACEGTPDDGQPAEPPDTERENPPEVGPRGKPIEQPPGETFLPPYIEPVPERLSEANTFVAEQPLPALTGGTLAAVGDALLVVSDPARDRLYVVDTATREVRTVALDAGDEPARLVIDGARAHVALRGAGAVATLALDSLELTRRQACSAPRGLALDPSSRQLLVACAGGELVTLAEDGSASRLTLEADLRDVGFDAQGLWVSRYRSAEVLRVDADGAISARVAPPAFSSMLENPPADTFSPTLAARTMNGPDGSLMMLHQRAKDGPVPLAQGGYGGLRMCDSGIVHATLSRLDGSGKAYPILPSSVLPLDLAVSPDGSHIAVVSPGGFAEQRRPPPAASFGAPLMSLGATRQLALLDSDNLVPDVDCQLEAPQWEHVFPGEAVAVSYLDDDRFAVQVQEPAQLRLFEYDDDGHARLVDVIGLSDELRVDTGHQLFHQSAGLGVACASCHGEGQDDAHVWTFDQIGPRRTQSLRGGILGSEPFHWSGDLHDFRALVDEVLTRRMGGAMLSDEWANALSGWIDTLPALEHGAAGDADAVARGRALFEASGCPTCHSGDAYRGPGSFDVGTGGEFQVPSLIGVSQRLPLMHSGCAATLHDRFDPGCGGDQHGDTANLEQGEIDDLVAFLNVL